MGRTGRRALITLIALAVLIATASALAAGKDLTPLLADLQITALGGTTPPAFAPDGLDGKRLALASLEGRPALLYFWATW